MDTQTIAIALGLIVSLLFTEAFGLSAGGMIVPGYFALSLNQPLAVLSDDSGRRTDVRCGSCDFETSDRLRSASHRADDHCRVHDRHGFTTGRPVGNGRFWRDGHSGASDRDWLYYSRLDRLVV